MSVGAYVLEHAQIPTFEDLDSAGSHLQAAKELKATKPSKKKRKKDVNYLTPIPQDPPFELDLPLADDEVIISLSIYHPKKKERKMQEWMVLGSDLITSLRDKIYCLSDSIMEGDKRRSSFFFFENTFYNDLRDEKSVDYSQAIIKWQQDIDESIGASVESYKSKKMEETKWEDLLVRCGVNYLYCHQGNCEHIVVINFIRFAIKSDKQSVNDYPLHVFQNKVRTRKCKVCDIYPAKYVTYNDPFANENPFFYCTHCYRPSALHLGGRYYSR